MRRRKAGVVVSGYNNGVNALPELSDRRTRLLRLRSQGLLGEEQRGKGNPLEVLKGVMGVQAQNLGAGRISLHARSQSITLESIEQARLADRSIAWSWFMRGTLHLVAAEDARWLVPLLAEERIRLGGSRMRQLGWDKSATLKALEILMREISAGPKTLAEIRLVFKAAGLPHQGQAPVHLVYRAAYEGKVCRGSSPGSTPVYDLFERVIGKPQPLPRQDGLRRLASRYLDGYAPAGPRDFAAWAGLSLTEARQAWDLLTGESNEVRAGDEPAWIPSARMAWLGEPLDDAPILRLLPMWDTYLLGYASRRLHMEDTRQPLILKNGIIMAVVLVDGLVKGTWEMKPAGKRLAVSVDLFEKLDTRLATQLEEEIASLGKFLGLEADLR